MLISNLSNILIFVLFCRLTAGERLKKSGIFYLPVVILFAYKLYFSQYFSPMINLGFSVLLYAYISLFYSCKVSKKVLLLVIYMSFSMLSEEMGLMVIEHVFDEPITLGSGIFYCLIIVSRIFLIALVSVSAFLLHSVNKENINNLDALHILVFPIATMFFIIVSKYPIYLKGMDVGFFISVLLFIIAIIVNCIELHKIQKNSQIYAEYEILKEKQRSDKEYYDLLLLKSEKEKQIMHDINKHDQYLSLLLSESKFDDAMEYLNQNIDNRSKERVIVTKNKTLDLILEMNRNKIVENDITLDISEVSKVDLSKIKEVDQCTIFANILENAIESCLRSYYRNISISLRKNNKGKIIFEVINSCDQVTLNNDNFVTTKNEGNHGYGLKNVYECLKKYNGIMKTSHKNKIFTTIIIFQ